jgi:hypothetical protein
MLVSVLSSIQNQQSGCPSTDFASGKLTTTCWLRVVHSQTRGGAVAVNPLLARVAFSCFTDH